MRRIFSKQKAYAVSCLVQLCAEAKGGRAKSPNPGAAVKGIYTTHIRTGDKQKGLSLFEATLFWWKGSVSAYWK